MFYKRAALVVSLLLSIFSAAPDVESRTIRVDSTAEFILGEELANDGFVELPLLAGPSGARVPFSVNFFGTVYDRIFINENGVVSFGAPLSEPPRNLTDVFNAGIPVIVPFFADADISFGRVHLTRTVGSNLLVSTSSVYQGSTGFPELIWQVAFLGTEGSTDFELELNYDGFEWESGNLDGGIDGVGGIPPRVGFGDGFGRTYEVPGSGVSGALYGEGCRTPLSLACNDYFFEFRNGLPYRDGVPIFPARVSEPTTMVLLLTALGLLVAVHRRRSRAAGRVAL